MKNKLGKMSHCELIEEDFPFKSSMTSSEVERRSFNCNWLCTLASNGLQMAIEVFFLKAAEAVVVASPKSLAASTTRWWKTRQDRPISHQAVRFSTNSKTCPMAVFTFSNAMIWQDLPPSNSCLYQISFGRFDEIFTIVFCHGLRWGCFEANLVKVEAI